MARRYHVNQPAKSGLYPRHGYRSFRSCQVISSSIRAKSRSVQMYVHSTFHTNSDSMQATATERKYIGRIKTLNAILQKPSFIKRHRVRYDVPNGPIQTRRSRITIQNRANQRQGARTERRGRPRGSKRHCRVRI